jgi:hypothetical protein
VGDFETVMADPEIAEKFTAGLLSLGFSYTKVGKFANARPNLPDGIKAPGATPTSSIGGTARGGQSMRPSKSFTDYPDPVMAGFGVRWIQFHHIIPRAVYRQNRALLREAGFRLNGSDNLMILRSPFHGNHPSYSRYVGQRIRELGPRPNLGDFKALQQSLRSEILSLKRGGKYERMNHYYKEKGY